MNWDDLRLFLSLARHGRVNTAAQQLQLDPTTLIRRIKRLESALNCNLCELSNKGYHLTDHGVRLLHYLERAEQHIFAAEQSLTDERKELSGTVRVSVSEGFGIGFLAPRLPMFKQDYPHINIELVASSGFLNIQKREADVAILLEKPTKGLLHSQKLMDYRLQFYLHKDLLPQQHSSMTLADLKDYPLVSYVADLVYAPQLKFIEEVWLSPMMKLSSTSILAQLAMLRQRAGVGILPCFLAFQAEELTPVRIQEIDIKRTFWLAWHRDVSHLARVQVFKDWLTALVNDDADIFSG